MIYLCEACLPSVDHFVGPNEPRECVCCGRADMCVEVDPKDLVLTLRHAQDPPLHLEALTSPSKAAPDPGVPPLVIPLPPAIPKIPTT